MPLNDEDTTIYILDSHCAIRLRGLLEQLLDAYTEALEERRYDQPGRLDIGMEEADMPANVSILKHQDDELF